MKRKLTLNQQMEMEQAASNPKIPEMLAALFAGPHGADAKDEFDLMLEEGKHETPEQTRARAKRLYQEFPSYEVWASGLTAENVAFIKMGFQGPRDYYDWFMASLAKFAGMVQ
jgi:hypothetical protein